MVRVTILVASLTNALFTFSLNFAGWPPVDKVVCVEVEGNTCAVTAFMGFYFLILQAI